MNNKSTIIISLVLVFLVGIFTFNYISGKNNQSVIDNMSENQENSSNDNVVVEPSTEDIITETVNGNTYQITQPSSVSYTVQKRFLQKEDSEVVGTTSSVTGTGNYNSESEEFEIAIEVDLTTLQSDSGGRDGDVAKLFTPKTANITISSSENPTIAFGEETTVDALITINNTTATVPLTTTISMQGNTLTAVGAATFNMSEFGITPPNAAGIYTVDDETVVGFDITAKTE